MITLKEEIAIRISSIRCLTKPLTALVFVKKKKKKSSDVRQGKHFVGINSILVELDKNERFFGSSPLQLRFLRISSFFFLNFSKFLVSKTNQKKKLDYKNFQKTKQKSA